MATRYTSYNSYDSRSSTTSSHFSDPSSSTELKQKSYSKTKPSSTSSRALVKSKPSDLSTGTKVKKVDNPSSLTAMMKKFMEVKSNSSSSKKRMELVIPSDVIAEDLKKTARNKGGNFNALQRKLFGKGRSEPEKKEVKALTEVKVNTRTLAMVLRSERELLSLNKEQEVEIYQLKLLLENKNTEVEKLKDLCLKQKEEIKALKSEILFPEVMNSQIQEVLEKQGSELKQARQVIPNLQRQVTTLTDQLQCLAEDLAEVKADQQSAKSSLQHSGSSSRTPSYESDHEEATNSWEISSDDATAPGSPDDMFVKDLNPCLTPHCSDKTFKRFETLGDDSPQRSSHQNNMKMINNLNVDSSPKLSRSSDCSQSSKTGKTMVRPARRSEESKGSYGRQMHNRFL